MRRWSEERKLKINFHFFLDTGRLNDLPLQSGFESRVGSKSEEEKTKRRLIEAVELRRKLEKINFNFFLTIEIESSIFALRF